MCFWGWELRRWIIGGGPPKLSRFTVFLGIGDMFHSLGKGRCIAAAQASLSSVSALIACFGLLVGALGISGCQSSKGRPEAADEQAGQTEQEYRFYPEAPDPPRFQYLKTLTTSLEFEKPQDEDESQSGLSKFLFGEREQTPRGFRFPDKPYGVDIYDGQVVVADLRGAMFVVYDLKKGEYREVAPKGKGYLRQPTNLTIDKDGTVYVCDAGRGAVIVYSLAGDFERMFEMPENTRPADVAIYGDRLYVANLKADKIDVVDKHTGDALFSFPKRDAEHQLGFPSHLYIRGDRLFVTEARNFRISQFTVDGEYIDSFGEVGDWPGSFARPKGVAVDREGRRYVLDAAFQNVQVFNDKNQQLMALGGPGMEPDNLNLPIDIVIDYDNVEYFRQYMHPDFRVEYLILISSQIGRNKVAVFGYGRMEGVTYPEDEAR